MTLRRKRGKGFPCLMLVLWLQQYFVLLTTNCLCLKSIKTLMPGFLSSPPVEWVGKTRCGITYRCMTASLKGNWLRTARAAIGESIPPTSKGSAAETTANVPLRKSSYTSSITVMNSHLVHFPESRHYFHEAEPEIRSNIIMQRRLSSSLIHALDIRFSAVDTVSLCSSDAIRSR